MHKHDIHFGTIDELRTNATAKVNVSDREPEERVRILEAALGHFDYARLSREDKGVVRIYLQSLTGYSRAQTARYITAYLHKPATVVTPAPVVSVDAVPTPVVVPAWIWSVGVAAFLLLLTSARADTLSSSVLTVLNSERTGITRSDLHEAALRQHDARQFVVHTVTGTGANAVLYPLLVVNEKTVRAANDAATETIVSWSVEDMLRRVEERRIARLRLHESGRLVARPDVTMKKDAFPAYPTREESLHGAASAPWDLPVTGKEGQVLMVQNGKIVWRDFPYLDQIRSQSPHGSEGTTRAGGRRSGGADSSQTNTTNNTTIIQQTGGGAPSGWTDGTAVVYLTESTDKVGIGTDSPDTKLEVVGTISGASLYIADSMSGAGLTDCDAGTSKLVYDATTGRFSCATDQTVGTGLSTTTADLRYVKKQGDTMTGALVINITGGNRSTIGLNVLNTISGAVIHAEKSLTTSGTLVFEGAASGSSLYISSSINGAGLVDCDIAGTSKLLWDSTTGRFSCGTDTDTDTNTTYTAGRGLGLNGTSFSLNSTITGALVRFNTVSGSTIYAQSALNASGSLSVDGTAFFNASAPLKLTNAGFYNCTALETDADGDITCGSDADTNTTYTAGQGLSLNSTVFSLSSTITGSLVRFTTLSGSTVYARNALNASGSLAVDGAASFNHSSFALTAFTNCGALETDGNGTLVCGSDADTNTTYTAGQGLSLNGTVFTLNATLTGTLIRFNTLSGSTVYAKNTLASSGSLTWEGAASGSSLYVATSIQGAGLSDCDTGNSVLQWNVTTGRFSCASITSGDTYTAGQGLTLNGNAFSLSSTITGALIRFTTVSGSTIYAKNLLNASGSLAVDGTTFLNSNAPLKLTDAGFYGCTALETDADGDIVCGSDADTNTTYTAGQGLGLNGTVFSLNTTITGSLIRFTTLSGSTVFARNALNASGSLAVDGAAAFNHSSFALTAFTNCTALETDGNGTLVCGTDGGTTYTAGQGLTLDGTSFRLNGTVTGSIANFLTVSGATVFAENRLVSSGSLYVVGNVTFNGNNGTKIYFHEEGDGNWTLGREGTPSGAQIVNQGAHVFVVYGEADNQGFMIRNNLGTSLMEVQGSDGQTYFAGSVGIGVVNPRTKLEVAGSISGATLYVRAMSGAGLTDCDAAAQALKWDATTERFSCGSAGSTYTAGQGLSLSAGNAFSLNTTITGALLRFTTVSGSTVYAKNQLTTSGTLVTESGAYFDGTTLVIQAGSNRVGINKADPKATVDIVGSLSGSSLTISSLRNCDTIDTDANGNFSCGSDQSAGTGMDQNTADERYVNRAGDSMTGALSINVTGGNNSTVALNVLNTISGAVIHAEKSLTTSGTLVFEGAASGSSLYISSSINGAGLVDCDIAGTSKLLWDSTTGRFSCGTDTDTDTNTTYTAGKGLTLAGTSFSTNDILTGSLIRFTTVSGSTIYAKNLLNASGSLAVDGTAFFNSNAPLKLTDAGFYGCTALETDADGDIVCGSDADTNTTYTAGQGLGLNGTVFSLNTTITGSLIRFTTVSGSTVYAGNQLYSSGTLIVEGRTTLNGEAIFNGATSIVSSTSAGLKIATPAGSSKFIQLNDATNNRDWYILHNEAVNGNDLTFQYFNGSVYRQYLTIENTGDIGIGTETPGSNLAVSGAVIIGHNIGSATADAGLGLEIIGTASGRIIRAQDTLASSGSLTWEGAASGASLYIGGTFEGAGLTDCDLATQTLTWDATTKRFSCGTDSDTTYTAGQGLTLNAGNFFSLNSTITGALVRFNTVSGSTIYAKNLLNASGSLAVDGTAYFNASTPLKLTDAGFYGCTALETDADGDLVCGADGVGSSYTAGQGLSLNSTVFSLNTTITGSLVRFTTVSGSTIYAKNQLTSSGTIVTESGAYFDGTTMVIQAGSNRVGIGTAAPGYTLDVAGQMRATAFNLIGGDEVTDATFNDALISMRSTMALRWNNADNMAGGYDVGITRDGTSTLRITNGSTGVGNLRMGLGSGVVIRAGNTLASSGTLVWEGAASGATLYLGGKLEGAGLTDCDTAGTSKLLWDATTGRFSCGSDQNTGTSYTAGQGLSLSAGNVFTINSTITGALVRFTTVSGSLVYAKNTLASSGSLTWEGAASGASLYIGGTFEGAGLTDCDLATQTLAWDATTKRFSCGTDSDTTYTAGQGLTLNAGNFFSLNSTITGSLVRFTTISGSVVKVKNTLASSGAIIAEGNITTNSGSLWQPVYRTDDGLIGYWSFSESGSTTAYDRSPYGLDGTLTNGPRHVAGKYGTALDFDGSDDRVTIPATATFGDATFAIWFNSDASTTQTIWESSVDFIDVQTATAIRIVVDASSANFAIPTVAVGSWHHLAVVKRGASFRVFLDGVESIDGAQTIDADASFTSIGGYNGDIGSNYWNGKLDEARIYNRALTEEEIRTQYLGVDSNSAIIANKFRILDTGNNLLVHASSGRILEVIGTVSGSTVFANTSLRSSGSLVWEGAASGASLYIGGTFEGAGLTDCDLATQTLAWDATTKRFSCGTDTDTNTTYTAGQGLSLSAGNAFSLNTTITGALVRFTTVSGSTVYAKNTLASSGSLTWEGAASGASLYIGGTLEGAGLTDCDLATQTLAWDATTRRFSCGTDSDTTYTAGQGLTLNAGNFFSLNSTITGALVRFTTLSGSVVFARNTLASSGTLIVKSLVKTGSGAATFVPTEFQSGAYVYGSGAGLLVLDSYSTAAGAKHILFGYRGTFDTNLYRAAASKLQTDGSFHVGNNLTTSGTLSVEGNAWMQGTIENGLINWMPFDTLTGSSLYTPDVSVTAGSGRLVNGPVQTTGKFGKALSFDATNDYVSIGNMDTKIGIANKLTVAAWIKKSRADSPDGSMNDRIVMSVDNNGWGFYIDSNGALGGDDRLAFTLAGVSGVTSNSSIADTNWHHVAASLDGTNIRFYIDGVLDRTAAYAPSFTSGGNYTIGSRGTSEYFGGNIDDVRVYNRPLSTREMADLYRWGSQSIGGTMSGIVILEGGTVPILNIRGSASGTKLFVSQLLASSGSLAIDGTTYLNSGAIITGKLLPSVDDLYDLGSTDKRWRDLYLGPASIHIGATGDEGVITYNTTTNDLEFDVTGDGNPEFTILSSGILEASSMSGSVIRAKNTLASSGSLVWEGAASGATLYVATSINGAGLTDCDAATSTLAWSFETGRFSCGSDSDTTYTAGKGLTLAGTSFSTNDILTGSLIRFNTVSGSTVYAKNLLTSSGTLTTESGAYFDGTTMVIQAGNNRVGIGTANPVSPLHVVGSAPGSLPTLDTGTVGLFESSATAGASSVLQIISGNAGNSALNFGDVDDINVGQIYFNHLHNSMLFTVNNALLMVMSGSNVGIGTTQPETKLEVVGTMSGRNIYISGTGSAPLLMGNTATGSIGIGTASPKGALHVVNGADKYTALFERTGVNGAGAVFPFAMRTDGQSVNDFIGLRFEGKDSTGGIQTYGGMRIGIQNPTNGAEDSSLDFVTFENGASNARLVISGSLVGIGTLTPKTKLEVAGTISGSSLTISGLRNCNTIDSDANGVLSCGTDETAASGLSVTSGDERYVNTSGDSMTGALTINVTGGNNSTIGLNILNTISGSVIRAQKTLASSGSLVWEGAASGATLYLGGKLEGAGLTDCDTATSVLQWNDATGRFSCTTISAGTTYTAGQGLSLSAGNAFSLNTTITGALVQFTTVSGSTVFAKNSLVSSGTLIVESGAILQYPVFITTQSGFTTSGLRIRNYMTPVSSFRTSTAVLESWSTARVNAPAFVFTSTGSAADGGWNIAEFQNKGLTKFAIDSNGGFTTQSAITVQPHLLTKSSSQSLYLHFGITGNSGVSSNNIGGIFAAASTVAASRQVVGSQWDGLEFFIMPNVEFGIGTTDPGSKLSVSGSAIIGTNITTQAADAGISLEVLGTASGRTIYAQQSLRSSGSLVWEGAASGATLYIGGTIEGAGLVSDCDGDTQTLGWDATTKRFTCGDDDTGGGSVSAGQGLALNGSVLTLNGTITGSLVRFTTVSGSTVYAKNLLHSSGTLVTESGAYFDGTTMVIQAGSNRVGIGTASPKTALEVVGTISGSLLNLNGSGSTTIMNYKVGIGTLAPQNKLHVLGQVVAQRNDTTGEVGFRVLQTGGTSNAAVFSAQWGSTFPFQLYHREDLDHQKFYFRDALIFNEGGANATGGVDILTLSGGMVGINTLRPSQYLTVSGSAVIRSSSKAGSGAAAIVAHEFQTGSYIYGSGAAALALDAYSNSGAKAPNILFGYRGNFDIGMYRFGSSNSGGLAIRTKAARTGNSVFQIESQFGRVDNLVFKVTASGGVYADSKFNSNGADYAEWFRYSGTEPKAGEVVCIDVTKKNTVARCTSDADSNVMGIVSTNPGFVGNVITGADGIIPPGYALVGLIGQVPSKVIVENGEAIRPGDSLTPASIPGYARKARAGESTVGVALEGVESGEGVVNVLISRRNQSLTVEAVEEKVLKTIANMEIEDEVELMVSSALGDLNVDQQITDEVTRQIDAITQNQQSIAAINAEIARLKEEIARIKSQTGATSYQPQATSGAINSNSHIVASSLELDSTLTTGADARIGGDLYIDGALNASSLFVPNGLTIDGGVVMNGVLAASQLTVSSGATIDGVLTINGRLNLASGATLGIDGALTISDLIVENALFVMGDITINGLATFLGDINVRGELIVSNNQAGFAMIPQSGTSVTVFFGTGFSATPVVTASPDVPVLYGVHKSSATGFTIRLAGPATEDIIFSWHALSTGEPIVFRADRADDGMLLFPTDENGVPVSSSLVWNACIRNIPMFDSEGQPLSCSRYHDAYTWTHPDLGLSFIWNTSMTPPLLKVSDSYTVQVTESAQSIIDAIAEANAPAADAPVETGTGSVTEETGTGSQTPVEDPVEETPVPEEEEEPTEEEITPPAEEITPPAEDPVGTEEEPVVEDTPPETMEEPATEQVPDVAPTGEVTE